MLRLAIGLILLFIALHGGGATAGQQAARFLFPIALAVLLSSLFSVIAHGNLFKQRRRNSKAWRLLSSKHRAERFVLYLRSFDSDERAAPPRLRGKLIDLIEDLESNGAFGSGSPIVHLIERSTARAFGKRTTVLGLAGPSAFMGPGQVSAYDSEWKSVIAELCRDAKAIVFVAGGSKGVRWELSYLQHAGHLHKVIFLVPSMSELRYHYGVVADVIVTRMKSIFDEYRISIPLPGKRTQVFTIGVPRPESLPELRDALTDALRRCATPVVSR